ncbi:MAG: hypothetical protein IT381_17195 [Deltaproteobacteria bacterium]|nr:hypothetical protein [Deltaproteobacteria bacterium]
MGIEPVTKAGGFAATVATLRRMVDAQHYAAFAEALAADTREIVDRPPSPSSWLAIGHWAVMLDAALRVAFDGRAELVSQLSERSMREDLSRAYKMAMRFTTPQFAITRATKLWDKHTQNAGRVEVELVASDRADVHFLEVPVAELPAFLPFQRGAVHAVLHLAGMREFEVQCVPGQDGRRQSLQARWRIC